VRLDIRDERIQELLQAWGTPYSWAAGKPADGSRPEWWLGVPGERGAIGFDCSGFAQVALVRLSLLSPTAGDRATAGLWQASTTIPEAEARLGDLAFYGPGSGRPGHVMLCLGGGAVLGATGGTNRTHGADPKAFVSLERLRYWPAAFLEVRRLKA